MNRYEEPDYRVPAVTEHYSVAWPRVAFSEHDRNRFFVSCDGRFAGGSIDAIDILVFNVL